MTDGRTELIITTDVGPRIIRYGMIGGKNMLKEYPEQLGLRGGKTWRSYGGHRLWLAPENARTTYLPDNEAVTWSWKKGHLIARQTAYPGHGIAKEINLSYGADGGVHLRHRLINTHVKKVTLAPWALTIMAPGGEAVFPHEPFMAHPEGLLPVRPLVLWPYTDMGDSRWTWGKKTIRLRQDPLKKEPQKIGVLSTRGWMAYINDGMMFIKHHDYKPGATYPDFGCNVETFVNGDMLELETLGPLVDLLPGASTEHAETWYLRPHRGRISDTSLTALASH
jgi:hypothetical protein